MAMKYYSNYWMHWIWNLLIEMIKENYETEENADDAICLGTYILGPVEDSRKVWESQLGKKFRKLIVYQTEPLVENHNIKTDSIINNIRGADEIWEFDYQNVLKLNQLGFTNVKYKPPLITKSIANIENSENPDIDLLFYGSFSAYRGQLIRSLHDGYIFDNNDDLELFSSMNFVWTWNLSESKLKEYIGRSKIVLNLHPYEGDSVQQTSRMFNLLSNNKQVISQVSNVNYFGDSIHQFSNIQEFGTNLLNLLRNDNWRIKPKNYNKHFLNKYERSNIAIFYQVDDVNQYSNQMYKLQVKGLFDKADYIHVNSVFDLPLNFYKVNRTTKDSTILEHINNFKKFNPEHKIIRVTDSSILEF